MRLYLLLIGLLILSAFGVGYFGFSFKNNYTPTTEDKLEIRNVKQRFTKLYPTLSSMNLTALYPSKAHQELVSTRASELNKKEVFYTKKDCFTAINDLSSNFSDHKVVFWEKFRCGDSQRLPGSFFSLPPYVHPSGYSYVYLFYRLLGNKKVDKSWVFNHFKFIKLDEYRFFKDKVGSVPKEYDFLADLNEDEGNLLMKSSPSLLTKDYYLVLDWDIFNFFEKVYYIYARKDFENYLEKTKYTVSFIKSNQRCLLRDGGLCWNFSLGHLIQRSGTKNLLLALLLIIFIIIGGVFVYGLISSERREDEKRKFALRVLSHELRTPLTGLLLKLESLLGKLDSFDDYSQDKLLKISSDAHRLRRLIEMSNHYLTASHKNKKITKIKTNKLESVNDFLLNITEDYPDVEFTPLQKDVGLVVDEYWLQVCVKNLIENAILHGQKPIKLLVSSTKRGIEIEVEDSGACEFDGLTEMTQEFKKGTKSEGTGLGLNIVMKIVKEMGSKLEFKKTPTRFTIIMAQQKESK